jgi:carboxyl-terminal processing protease
MKKLKSMVPGWTVLFVLCVLNGVSQTTKDNSFEIMKNLDIYANLVKELNTEYVDEINPGELTQTGIEAMLESLDPYTNFIPESQVEDFRFMTTGQYGGIGALIHQQGNFVIISEPYEGSPAQKSGLKAGDKILEINGQKAEGKSYDEVSTILKGQAGTTVILLLQRDGVDQPIEKSIVRENIRIDNIPYSGIVGGDIGYMRLSGFTQNAAKEVRQAFLKLKEEHSLTGLVIDLRGNGGGLLNEAVDIANLFVERGQDIVSTRGKQPDKNRTHQTLNPSVDLNIPLVILVDRQSASASEILAGSMQDLDRGVIIGQKTFGKGLVQNVVPLSYNAQAKITVAKYYIPSGRCIQAIDYSKKNGKGEFTRIPDSLIRSFTTKNGRVVYDAGGISPDLMTPPRKLSKIALTLYSKYLIFDFVTLFERNHPSISTADQFEIDDSLFNDFLSFISNKDYSYSTLSEQALEQLKKNALKENYFDAIKVEYDHLKAQMEKDKKEDLNRYKDQINDLLRMEIVTRYYYQKGKIETSLKKDTTLAEAISVLHNTDKYKSILAGTYLQPDKTKLLEIQIEDSEEEIPEE